MWKRRNEEIKGIILKQLRQFKTFALRQELITRSEQLPSAGVTASTRTSLFSEGFWREFGISFKFHKTVNKTYTPKNEIFCPINNV